MVGGDQSGDLEGFANDVKTDIIACDGLQRIPFISAIDEALLGHQIV